MLSEDHIKQLISENEFLQVQLEEVNGILADREKELEELRAAQSEATRLRSLLDTRLDELHSMQNIIGEQEQQVMGAEEREIQLQKELTEAVRLQHQYNELVGHYAYIQAQLEDVQTRLTELNTRNLELQKIAAKIGELESQLANSNMERDELKNLVTGYNNQAEQKTRPA